MVILMLKRRRNRNNGTDGDEVLDAEEEKEWGRLYYNWTHAAEQVESGCWLVTMGWSSVTCSNHLFLSG